MTPPRRAETLDQVVAQESARSAFERVLVEFGASIIADYTAQVESRLREHEARLFELLRERDEWPPMLTPSEAGRRLGKGAQWVRDHRDELGVVALGSGPKPRLGVPAERVEAFIACSSSRRTGGAENGSGKPSGRRKRPGRSGRDEGLLPIRGEVPR
jgi:hypothetical protein